MHCDPYYIHVLNYIAHLFSSILGHFSEHFDFAVRWCMYHDCIMMYVLREQAVIFFCVWCAVSYYCRKSAKTQRRHTSQPKPVSRRRIMYLSLFLHPRLRNWHHVTVRHPTGCLPSKPCRPLLIRSLWNPKCRTEDALQTLLPVFRDFQLLLAVWRWWEWEWPIASVLPSVGRCPTVPSRLRVPTAVSGVATMQRRPCIDHLIVPILRQLWNWRIQFLITSPNTAFPVPMVPALDHCLLLQMFLAQLRYSQHQWTTPWMNRATWSSKLPMEESLTKWFMITVTFQVQSPVALFISFDHKFM